MLVVMAVAMIVVTTVSLATQGLNMGLDFTGGVQIEANFAGVRDNAANRERFADVTAQVLEQYLRLEY